MFLKNYYIIPFIAEFLIGIAIMLKGDLLFIHSNVASGLGISVLALSAHRFYKMLSKASEVSSLALAKPLEINLDHIKPNKDEVFIGKGFVWENKHVQKMNDLSQIPQITKYYSSEDIDGDPTIHGVGKEDEKNIFLKTKALSLQTTIVGGTGSGKTRLMELLVVQAILRDEPVIIIDPKGDNDLVDRVHDTCRRCNRENDYQFFSLPHPKHSATYNPLDNYGKASDIASRIKSIMDTKGESFYRDFIWGLIRAVVDGLLVLGQAVTLKEIEKYALGDVKKLFEKVSSLKKQDMSPEQILMQDSALKNLKQYTEKPEEYFDKIRTNLTPVLQSLTGGEIGTLLSSIPSDISWEKVVQKKKVVYLYLGSMLDATVAQNVGRLALQDFLYYVGSIYAHQQASGRIPINLFVDEFYNVMFDGYVDLLNKSRGAGVRVTLGMQTSKDIEAVVDPAKAAQILANTTNKIFLKTPEPVIAKLFEDLYGKTTIQQRMDTDSAGADVKEGSGNIFSSSSGKRRMPKEVVLVDKRYITSLLIGQAFMYTQGRAPYKLRLPLISNPIEYSFMEQVIGDTSRRVY